MLDMHSQLLSILSSTIQTACARCPNVHSHLECRGRLLVLHEEIFPLVTVFSSLKKQFCHVAKSNVLAPSNYQAEQVASAAVHTVCIGASA